MRELPVANSDDIEKKLKQQYEESMWGIIDGLTLNISCDYLVSSGTIVCKKSVRKFSCDLVETLKKGNLPNLNPVLDEVYKYKTEENTSLEAFDKFIIETAEFKTQPIDTKQDFLNIETSVKIMWTNVLPFIDNQNIRIERAEIQTGLFRREIN